MALLLLAPSNPVSNPVQQVADGYAEKQGEGEKHD
jgi:hypothetical protein